MVTNNIEITGKLELNPLYWNLKNASNKECILVHLILLEDDKNNKYSNIPVYIHDENLQKFITNNTAFDKENVIIKGVLGSEKSPVKNKYQYYSPCYIALTNDQHSIKLIEKKLAF
jgi:hypothetical protein